MINHLISSKIPIEMKVLRQFILTSRTMRLRESRRNRNKNRKIVIMYEVQYDTPVSNEFIRVGDWKKEHLLSPHHYRFLSVTMP